MPVQWVDSLALRSLADIDARLTAHYDYFGTLAHAGTRAIPTTCKEWLELHAQGYAAAGSSEARADDAAIARCVTLEWLRSARAAQRGWVRDIHWGELPLSQLPAALATTESPEREHAVLAASAAQRSLQDLDGSARIRRSPIANSCEITERDNQSNILLRVEAWGDFNGDGLDDVVATIINSRTQGDYQRTRLLALTRSAADQKLRVVRER